MGKSISKFTQKWAEKRLRKTRCRLEWGQNEIYLTRETPLYANGGSLGQQEAVRRPTDLLPEPPMCAGEDEPPTESIYHLPTCTCTCTCRHKELPPTNQPGTGISTHTIILPDDSSDDECVVDDSGFDEEPLERPGCSNALHSLVNQSSSMSILNETDLDEQQPTCSYHEDSLPRAHLVKSDLEQSASSSYTRTCSYTLSDSDSDGYQNLDDIRRKVDKVKHPSRGKRKTKRHHTTIKKVYKNCTFIKFKKSSGVQVGPGGAMHYTNPFELNENSAAYINVHGLLSFIAQNLGSTVHHETHNFKTRTTIDELSSDVDSDDVQVEEEIEVVELQPNTSLGDAQETNVKFASM